MRQTIKIVPFRSIKKELLEDFRLKAEAIDGLIEALIKAKQDALIENRESWKRLIKALNEKYKSIDMEECNAVIEWNNERVVITKRLDYE